MRYRDDRVRGHGYHRRASLLGEPWKFGIRWSCTRRAGGWMMRPSHSSIKESKSERQLSTTINPARESWSLTDQRLAGQQARLLILSGADFASQSRLVHSRWYSPHGEHIPKPPENDVIHNIILGIACFVLGWITQALFAGRRERENDDILLNEINRSRKKYYES